MASRPIPTRSGNPYMVAVVLGTALTTFSAGESASAATTAGAAPSAKAVADLDRYCTACWRNARLPLSAWPDCTQEVFRRLLERVPAEAWERVLGDEGAERREFVRAIDAVKKRTQRARKWSSSSDDLPDSRALEARRRADERDAVRRAAESLLSSRQQRVLQLSFEGWSVQEIADELGVGPERISDEKYKAVRKLRAHLGEHEETTSAVPA
jgi:RNA polymerase sigma factor (sigma-70 family)